MRCLHDFASCIAGSHLRLLLAILARGCQQALLATAASVTLTSNGEWEGQTGPVLSLGTLGAGGGAGGAFNMEWTPPRRLTRREDAPLQLSLLGDVEQQASSTSTKAPDQTQQASLTLSAKNPFDLSDKLVSAKDEDKFNVFNEENFGYRNSTYWEDRRRRRFWIDTVWSIAIGTFAFTGCIFFIVVFASKPKSVTKGLGESDASRSGPQQQTAEGGATSEGGGENNAQPVVAEPDVAVSNSSPAEPDAAVSNAVPVT